jgi:hypothetical protein
VSSRNKIKARVSGPAFLRAVNRKMAGIILAKAAKGGGEFKLDNRAHQRNVSRSIRRRGRGYTTPNRGPAHTRGSGYHTKDGGKIR